MTKGRSGRGSYNRLVPMNGPRLRRSSLKRICSECATVLSIYNSTAFCSLHEPRRPPSGAMWGAGPLRARST